MSRIGTGFVFDDELLPRGADVDAVGARPRGVPLGEGAEGVHDGLRLGELKPIEGALPVAPDVPAPPALA